MARVPGTSRSLRELHTRDREPRACLGVSFAPFPLSASPTIFPRSVSRSRAPWNFIGPFNSCQLEAMFLKRKGAVSRVNRRLLSARLAMEGRELLLEVRRMVRKSRFSFRSLPSLSL